MNIDVLAAEAARLYDQNKDCLVALFVLQNPHLRADQIELVYQAGIHEDTFYVRERKYDNVGGHSRTI